jgi:hypothetical protein
MQEKWPNVPDSRSAGSTTRRLWPYGAVRRLLWSTLFSSHMGNVGSSQTRRSWKETRN